MPMLIEHIDAIARQKQRDVLFVEFHPEDFFEDPIFDSETGKPPPKRDYNFRTDPMRQQVVAWLDQHHIGWRPCGHYASETCMLSYQGQIYLDVPFDEHDPVYQTVRNYLEHADGTMRFPTVRFYALPLEHAMKNAHHDEPGFWKRWADEF